MNVFGNFEKGYFFTAVRNAAEKVINSDPCQGCYKYSRSVKACLPEVCCPKPSENSPLVTQPLLGRENVTEQPKEVVIVETEGGYLGASSNEVDSGPHSILAFSVPYESFDPYSESSSASQHDSSLEPPRPLPPFSSLLRYFKLPCS